MARGLAGTVASERVEIVRRGERRRSFSAEEKVRLVTETFGLGETVTAVSRRHGICTSLLHRWWRTARGEVPSRRAARAQLLPVRVVAPDAALAQSKPTPIEVHAPAETDGTSRVELIGELTAMLRAAGVAVAGAAGGLGALGAVREKTRGQVPSGLMRSCVRSKWMRGHATDDPIT